VFMKKPRRVRARQVQSKRNDHIECPLLGAKRTLLSAITLHGTRAITRDRSPVVVCFAQRIPARRKLWIKARWNTRKTISRGADVISAAAQMIDQSTP